MIEDKFDDLEKRFLEYARSFYSEDSFILRNIKLKEGHSLRVCKNASLISASEKLDCEERYLAMTIALFHDIGRFEQLSRYRTFRDSESEDHALLGVKVLKSAGILSVLSPEQQDTIYQAIWNHNRYRIPDGLDSKCLFHSRLVRDADKLDIFKVLTDYYSEKDSFPNPALDMGLPDIPEYSQSLLDDIFNCRIASTANVKTCNDMRLTRLSWVFDLNFPETLRLVRERGYIDMIVEKLPQDNNVAAIHAHLKGHMDSVLNPPCKG
ncbi:metal-dependent phosphohydrolase [Methanolobus psychrophilus R15]|nr:metal-dependent phosphohydrolase [Methanolobus psychrophilus R15]